MKKMPSEAKNALDIERYFIRPEALHLRHVKKKSILNWRDYLIPTKRKGKRNVSGSIDNILYGKK